MVLVVIFLLIIIVAFLPVMHHARQQMLVGAKIMDGLTEADLLGWIAQAETFLPQHEDGLSAETARGASIDSEDKLVELFGAHTSIYADKLPAGLVDQQIQRVDIMAAGSQWPASVSFVWMGGFDHTCLRIERDPAGGHRVIAVYNDYRSKQIWPVMEGDEDIAESPSKPDAT